jgi:putative DNA primase/helicase
MRPQPTADEAVRKYALAALDSELQAVRSAMSGQRNAQLNASAFKIATLVAAGALDGTMARFSLEAAARDNPGHDDDRQLLATIDSGWSAGLARRAICAKSKPMRASAPTAQSPPSNHPRPAAAAIIPLPPRPAAAALAGIPQGSGMEARGHPDLQARAA